MELSMDENVVELAAHHPWARSLPREIDPADWHRYRGYMAEIFEALGLEPDTPGTRETPERFLRALYDATSGYEGDPKLLTAFPAEHGRSSEDVAAQIVEGPIGFHCLCEHHALPFFGSAYLAYVADRHIIGISKLTRLVKLFARRFTVQERLGEQIADTLVEMIEPRGVALYISAEHLCTHMRGVEESSTTVTTFWRGAYADADLRREFLQEVHARRHG